MVIDEEFLHGWQILFKKNWQSSLKEKKLQIF